MLNKEKLLLLIALSQSQLLKLEQAINSCNYLLKKEQLKSEYANFLKGLESALEELCGCVDADKLWSAKYRSVLAELNFSEMPNCQEKAILLITLALQQVSVIEFELYEKARWIDMSKNVSEKSWHEGGSAILKRHYYSFVKDFSDLVEGLMTVSFDGNNSLLPVIDNIAVELLIN